MDKLNKLGKEVMEYKNELMNNKHSDLVKRSLMSSITDLMSSGIITIDVHDVLTDETATVSEVREQVLNTANLIKTEAELREEYDALRKPFFERLTNEYSTSKSGLSNLISESHVNLEEVQFILSFKMTKEFISNYFEREDEQLEVMMRPEGFAEKFAILRYGALVSKFLKSHDAYDDSIKRAKLKNNIQLGGTKVFINKDEEIYGVELVYHVPVSNLTNEEESIDSLASLGKSIKDANEFIHDRTIS